MRHKHRRGILWMFLLVIAVAFLMPQTGFAARNNSYRQLNIDMFGDGNGIVRGHGIKCIDDCSRQYRSGTWITLTAKLTEDSQFVGWSGCDKSSGKICVVHMNHDKSIMVSFDSTLPIEILPPLLTTSLGTLTAPALIGSTGTVLANIKLTNSSAENVRLSSIAFTYTGPLYAIQNAKLYNGNNGTQIGPTIGAVGGDGKIAFHSLDVIIPSNSSMDLTVRADISMSATVGDMITLSIGNPSDVIAAGITSGHDASVVGTPVSVTTIISSSILQVFIGSGSPSIISSGQGVEMMRLGFFAESWGEYVLFDSITVSFSGVAPENLTNIRLITPWYSQIGNAVPSLDGSGKAIFKNLNWTIPPGSVQELRIYADLYLNTWGAMTVSIHQPSDISAVGLTTATTTLIGGNFPLIWSIVY
ncbi:MAG: hypothetical protein AAB949_01270 [Patescibacteria group bacterium]